MFLCENANFSVAWSDAVSGLEGKVEGSGGGRGAPPRRAGRPHSFSSFPAGLVGFAFLGLLGLACVACYLCCCFASLRPLSLPCSDQYLALGDWKRKW